MIFSKEKLSIYETGKNIYKLNCIKNEKSNFQLAFYVLPKQKRIALSNLYIFCSYLDDIVDSGTNNNQIEITAKKRRLDWWKSEINKISSYNSSVHNNTSIIFPLKKLIEDYGVPKEYFEILIDGVGKDLTTRQYETFEELLKYCYGVASIVGLMCAYIFGDTSECAREYAINLGYALQLTNIMRDINEDFSRNYIYLPQEDLRKFNYSIDNIREKKYNKNFIDLMQFQHQRVEKYYNFANISLHESFKKEFLPAEIMKNIYYELLQKITMANYNIYPEKIRLHTYKKIFTVAKTILTI